MIMMRRMTMMLMEEFRNEVGFNENGGMMNGIEDLKRRKEGG